MEQWLFNIIKNGTLVDNQLYSVDNGVLTNNRLQESIDLQSREKNQRKNCVNNEFNIWCFLNSISYDVANRIKNEKEIVLFNDKDYEHNTEDFFINISGTDARNFKLSTGNLVGYVKQGDYALKISSRFGDLFLRYIIADADGFLELKDVGGESAYDGYDWLLAYLWNIKLKKAFRLGLPKTYVSRRERTSRVRGTIDVVDYFQNKETGMYKCSFREQSYENEAITLFVKAYDSVKKYSFCQSTRNIYNALLIANQGWKRTRQEILNIPSHFFSNSYYSDYNSLIELSKRIIYQKGTDFGSTNEASAFFFDISMLFEYFIRKLLKREGAHLHSKFEQRCEIPSGVIGGEYKRKLEPDLFFEYEGAHYLFDVKYKNFDQRYGVKREDLFQLHTYIGQYGNDVNIRGCGFIYPISESKWNQLKLDKTQGVVSDIIYQQSKKIAFYVVFLKIPDNNNSEFPRLMKKECDNFIQSLRNKVFGR